MEVGYSGYWQNEESDKLVNEFTLHYSGAEIGKKNRKGVSIIISKELNKKW